MTVFPDVDYDVAVVGAGFSGLLAVHTLVGRGYSVKGFEKAADVGGTWWWNRYPGARCDVDSVDYCYSFDDAMQQEWDWSERFATQPEILRYLNWVADRLDLRRHYDFGTAVAAAEYDAQLSGGAWRIAVEAGPAIIAKFLILGTGNLVVPFKPDIPGIGQFTGEIIHSAAWPSDETDFADKRVAIIGTGSTSIQMVPCIAPVAQSLTVFQRTPSYSMPARHAPLEPEYVAQVRAGYSERRALSRSTWSGLPIAPANRTIIGSPADEVATRLQQSWDKGGVVGLMATFDDIGSSAAANEIVGSFLRDRIREVVKDEAKAAILSPTYAVGAKRIAVDNGYFAAFNLPHVDLVDVNARPITRIEPTGIVAGDELVAADVIIFATGFDAVTGALLALNPTGMGGVSLQEHWADGAAAYMGVGIAGFPNMFVIASVGTATVVTAILPTIEHNVGWIANAIDYVRDKGLSFLAASAAAESDWMSTCASLAAGTQYMRVKSWQNGQNIPGKANRFMAYVGGVAEYIRIADEIASNDYAGFDRG